jgi:ribonuclease P protein component
MIFTDTLKSNIDFSKVYKNGKSYANRLLVMYIKENGTGSNRLGISVSKKVGNSVVRHRLKRLVKESYRLQEAVFNSGLDIVIVARKEAPLLTFDQTNKSLLRLGKLHGIIKE